jgi:hypothetical protein
MKKIMIAALGLSFLTGSFAFAQNTSTDTNTMKSTKKTHKSKKSKSSTSTTSTSK